MLVDGQPYTTLQFDRQRCCLSIIDQTLIPHQFAIVDICDLDSACNAISSMKVRGAPLIGATAAFGLVIALKKHADDETLARAAKALMATRPTAINLHWAIECCLAVIQPLAPAQRYEAALQQAETIRTNDITTCEAIGEHGVELIRAAHQQLQRPINILTHCNAGWLATVDWGTALAPIYKAQQAGIPVHVWVDETRPRNQGASLTAWELRHQGIEHTVIADNTGGHLMQHGLVDMCIVGSDRTTANGDVCNKIGTYLKALAAHDNDVPFYVALPISTIDWQLNDGIRQIPIEQRDSRELTHVVGLTAQGEQQEVALFSQSAVANYAFDVTPAKYISGLITEHGIVEATTEALDNVKQKIKQNQFKTIT